MKREAVSLAFVTLAVAGAASVTKQARADEFPEVTRRAVQSATRGFAQSSLPTLVREAVSDPLPALLTQVCPSPCKPTVAPAAEGARHVTGEQWSLDISADGSLVEFHDRAVETRAHGLARDPVQKMSAAALEQAGRAFIEKKLSRVITLGGDEGLVAIRSAYRTEASEDVRTHARTMAIAAHRIVFSRTVHGVPVVGGGSTVTITFTNDGSVESFRYDWPAYRASSAHSQAAPAELLARVQDVLRAVNGTKPSSAPTAKDTSQPYPIVLSDDTTLEELQCGYYDPGAATRDPRALVQTGCEYRAIQRRGGSRAGFTGAVPGATAIEPDSKWLEARILRADPIAPSSRLPADAAPSTR